MSDFFYLNHNYSRKIDKSAPFVLLGNRIDGSLNFIDKQYRDFDELKDNLLNDLKTAEGLGEWTIDLYQVQQNSKIHHKYGYFQYPKPAKHIYAYSYMNPPIQNIYFKRNEISFVYIRFRYNVQNVLDTLEVVTLKVA